MKSKLATAAVRHAVPVLGTIALTLLIGCSEDPNAGGELRQLRTDRARGPMMWPEG